MRDSSNEAPPPDPGRCSAFMDEYPEAGGEDGRLTGRCRAAVRAIKRGAAVSGPSTCCHTFPVTGGDRKRVYLANGGTLETRPVDRRARVVQDHGALRPASGHGDGPRDGALPAAPSAMAERRGTSRAEAGTVERSRGAFFAVASYEEHLAEKLGLSRSAVAEPLSALLRSGPAFG